MEKEYLISHPSQLNNLSVFPLKRNQSIGKIRLGGNMLNNPKVEFFENLLNKNYYSCGCSEGAKGLVVGLILGFGFIIYKYIESHISIINAIVIILVSFLGFSIIGKSIGLIIANKRLKNSISEIKSVWPPEKEHYENIHCG